MFIAIYEFNEGSFVIAIASPSGFYMKDGTTRIDPELECLQEVGNLAISCKHCRAMTPSESIAFYRQDGWSYGSVCTERSTHPTH